MYSTGSFVNTFKRVRKNFPFPITRLVRVRPLPGISSVNAKLFTTSRVQELFRRYSSTVWHYKFPVMVETKTSSVGQSIDEQTQFGNSREFEPSDCLFVFKDTQSDYEEPESDEEVVMESGRNDVTELKFFVDIYNPFTN